MVGSADGPEAIPDHDGHGRVHFASAVDADALELATRGIWSTY